MNPSIPTRTPALPTATPSIWHNDTARSLIVLAASGIGGFHAGMVTYPDWQVAVETAQVVAGIVDYPPGNPFYVYHMKLWTVLHQISALLLLSGASEILLSKIFSGLVGMVSFQALAMIVYALSRDVLLAIGAAFLIAFTRTAEYGVLYPIYLMGTSHTYGAIGLSLVALTAGLLGAGWYRTGGLLLGVAPAVHPSLGAWFVLIVGVSAIWQFRSRWSELRPALWFVAIGCGITVVSLLVHLLMARDLPSIDQSAANRYLTSFVTFWDMHRQPVDPGAEGTRLNMGALALALGGLNLATGLPGAAMFLLRIVAVTSGLGVVLMLISHIPPAALPSTLLILMPGRLMNLNALKAVAILLGLVGGTGRRLWSWLLGLYLSIGLIIGNRSMFWEWLAQGNEGALRATLAAIVGEKRTRPLQILLAVSVLLILAAALSRWRARQKPAPDEPPGVAMFTRYAGVLAVAARAVVLTILAGAMVLLWQWPPRPADQIFIDRTNSEAFEQVARGPGVLLTGGDLHLVQLRTRRPVLLDGGGLDGLPYALEAGPAMERILRDAYEIDLFNPPEEARGRGAIPNEINQAAWEGFSLDRWQQIRRTHHVSQVMTDPRWVLTLPVAVRGPGFVLYNIPD